MPKSGFRHTMRHIAKKNGKSLKDVENVAHKFMRVLAYGTSADAQDAQDEYLRVSETVTRDALRRFVEGVISCFSEEYLRRPNEDDLARLLHPGKARGFPGMIRSIDCMHWGWKNCPNAWDGQYTRGSGKATIILEVIASYDLWVWHAFFGTPGSCNDINVLHRYPILDDVLSGKAPHVSYVVNDREYNKAYYLTDSIYPSWAAFVKSITSPQLQKHMNQQQRSYIEDEDQPLEYSTERIADLSSYITNRTQLRNREAHNTLKNDLIEHLWQKFATDG